MIIFYNKATGVIEGVIHGRTHNADQLRMWAGDKELTDRLIVEWVPIKYHRNEKGERIAADYQAEIQPEIFAELDSNVSSYKEYRIDLETKLLYKTPIE